MVYIDDQTDQLDLAEGLRLVSSQRREQALRIRHEQGRRLCVAAYLLLKRALLEQEGIDENPLFEYGPHGKPTIAGHPELHFSLSHCREAAACVLSRRPVGIDVEGTGRFRESVARYAMSEAEMARILQAPRPEVEFTRLWTMKESLLKLTGQGINDRMKGVLEGVPPEAFTTVERLDRNYIYTVCEL
ncbi:MAG: 4'-phosphopantetheinyl transferase superfamily protein [Prevotella sp.]|nr:4'-phosphopantetheinyl transferase superfamily protein [Prevotella sp.]